MRDAAPPLWPDLVVWSSVWLAAATTFLQAAAARALGVPIDPLLAVLAFCGSVYVYARDHRQGLAADRTTSPHRTAFLEHYGTGIGRFARMCLLIALGAGALLLARSSYGWRVVLLAGIGLGLGLVHTRLKRHTWSKPLYVSLAWTLVVVGFPVAAHPAAQQSWQVAGVVFATGVANVLLYNLRPGLPLAARLGPGRGRLLAALWLLGALVLALWSPAPVHRLGALPLAMAIGLVWPAPGERAAAWAIDGYLLMGALLALVLPVLD